MALTTDKGQGLNSIPQSVLFDIDAYLSNIHNEDGSPLTTQQRDNYANAIKKNGLSTIDSNGLAVMVVLPVATR